MEEIKKGQKSWFGPDAVPYGVTVMAVIKIQGREIPLRGPRGEILEMQKIPPDNKSGMPKFKIYGKEFPPYTVFEQNMCFVQT